MHFYLMPLFEAKRGLLLYLICYVITKCKKVKNKMHVIWCKWWLMKKRKQNYKLLHHIENNQCLLTQFYIVNDTNATSNRSGLAWELSNRSGLACELCADSIATVATETWSNQNIYWKWMRCTEKKSPVHKSMIRCQSNKPTKLLVESRLKKDLNPCTYICLK